MHNMIGYIKKEEFDFNGIKDLLELQAIDFKLNRISVGVMQLITNNFIYIQYVNTVIYKEDINNKKITLNNGGFYTATTKKYINRFLPKNIGIFQNNYNWYISLKGNYPRGKKELNKMLESGEVVEFENNITINY